MKVLSVCKIIALAAGYMFLFQNPSVSGQELSKTELEDRASALFAEGAYARAASDYEILLDMYPKENRYAYYLGRSYLGANTNLDTAIELLKKSATRNYGEDTYFYLGRAYHLNYEFDEARHAILVFKNTARKKDIRKYRVDYWLQVIESARKSVLVARKLEVEDMQEVSARTLESAFTGKQNGKFIFVPGEFMTAEAKDKNYQSLMYISEDIQVGDYLYYSSLSKGSRTGTDIYRVQRVTAEDYSLPELLPAAVNTGYNEAYPFFDTENSMLYYCSDNPLTTGGYDIFRVSYEESTGIWGKAEKLEFPVNSVYDDILFTPLDASHRALFLSTRNSDSPDYHAYTIFLNTESKFLIPSGREEVLELAMLAPASITVDNEDFKLAMVAPYRMNDETPQEEALSPYDLLINEAMACQMKSDSLAWLADEMKKRAVASENLQEKQARINNIAALEQESGRLQQLADEKFLAAEQLNRKDDSGEVVTKAGTTASGLTLYAYNTATTATAGSTTQQMGIQAGTAAAQQLSLGFSIAQESPYSAQNPIPETYLPDGLVYRIQLGAFTNEIPENTFGGLTPVSRERAGTSTKYYVGYFKSVTDARDALAEVKAYGYPDAFIVSYYQSEKIPVQRAREIEFAGKGLQVP